MALPVLGQGNINAKVFGIGEAPGYDEIKQGEVWVGKAGKCLDRALKKADLKRYEEIFLDNVCTLMPENYGYGSNKPTDKEIARDRDHLLENLNKVKPQYIIPFGSTATEWFKDELVFISQEIGKVFSVPWLDFPHQIIPTYHPSGIIRDGEWKNFDVLFGALAYSSFSTKVRTEEFSTEIETILVEENQLDYAFAEIEKAHLISIDIEAASKYANELLGVGIAVSPYKAFYFPYKPLTEMFGFAFVKYYQNKFEHLQNFLRKVISSPVAKIAQNAKYDMHGLENELKVPFNNLVYDTMELARLVYNNFFRRGADYLGKVLRPPYAGWKDKINSSVKGKQGIGWEEIPLDVISKYCCYDATHEYWFAEILRHYL